VSPYDFADVTAKQELSATEDLKYHFQCAGETYLAVKGMLVVCLGRGKVFVGS
jgi:hypothetical protein